jgi:hypothetical protein
MVKSSYLKSGRLGEVLVAIQAMGADEVYYARGCNGWAKVLGEHDGQYWEQVLKDHGEFFRKVIRDPREEDRYALVWRMAFQEEPTKTPKRRVLSPEEIKLLCDIAVNMHAKAVDAQRWWVAPVLAFVGSVFGALIAFAAAGLFRGAH